MVDGSLAGSLVSVRSVQHSAIARIQRHCLQHAVYPGSPLEGNVMAGDVIFALDGEIIDVDMTSDQFAEKLGAASTNTVRQLTVVQQR